MIYKATVDLGMRDLKGRAIGVMITTWVDGAEYCAIVGVTRNGKRFGASQPTSRFTSAAERDTEIDRRVRSARARYAKVDALYRRMRREPLTSTSACPECGHTGPHDDNGAARVFDRSYSCAGCGLSFDALPVVAT